MSSIFQIFARRFPVNPLRPSNFLINRSWLNSNSIRPQSIRLIHTDFLKRKSSFRKIGLFVSSFCGAASLSFGFIFGSKSYDVRSVQCAKKVVANDDDDEEKECDDPECQDSVCMRQMDEIESAIKKANSEMVNALKETKKIALENAAVATKLYCEAAEVVQDYMDKAYTAMEYDHLSSPDFEEMWCCVFEASKERCVKGKAAYEKGEIAWELLGRLEHIIAEGRKCKYTECNPLLLTAEDSLICAKNELVAAKKKMECIQSNSELVDMFSPLVIQFRKELKSELGACAPGEKECPLIVELAYRKLIRIQKEMTRKLACEGKTSNCKTAC